MADKLLSIVLEKLASVVQQQVELEVSLVVDVEKEVQYLTNTLQTVRDVLEDAERREVKDRAVRNWLEKLKDLAYQMDNVVDEWSTDVLKLQIHSLHKRKVSSCSIIPAPCICFKLVVSLRDIALKIKGIKQQLDACH